jgi:hypothetical protein
MNNAFYEHYRDVTPEEFAKAKRAAKRIAELKELRAKLLASKQIDPEFVLPSKLWQGILDFFCSYCNDPSYELVNSWRLHTAHYSGRYPGFWIENEQQPISTENLVRYFHHTQGLPDSYIVRPPAMMAEMGWWLNGGHRESRHPGLPNPNPTALFHGSP